LDTGVVQAVADSYDETMERYLRYQDHLFRTDQLPVYEKKMYLRRRRQKLLWKILLDDLVESLPAYRQNPVAELKHAVAEGTATDATVVGEEIDRVLALRALVAQETPEGTRFAWTE